MPVSWTVRDDIVFLTLIGDFELHEIQSATLDAYSEVSTPPGIPVLVDGRLSLAHISPDEARRRGEWFGYLLKHGIAGRCAMVVGVSEYRQQILAEGIAPLAQAGLPLRIFTSFADAVTWLKGP